MPYIYVRALVIWFESETPTYRVEVGIYHRLSHKDSRNKSASIEILISEQIIMNDKREQGGIPGWLSHLRR